MSKNLTCLSCSLILCCLLGFEGFAQSGFHLAQRFKIPSGGGWDYISVFKGRIYASHGGQVNVLNEKTGDSVGVIPNTLGVHGIAFDAAGHGFTSNGRLNTITEFDQKTNDTIGQIPVGQGPDAIMFDSYSGKIITCNGRGHDLSLVDPASRKVVATIPVGGKPETAVSDGAGKLYVNIEDKSQIDVVDLASNQVKQSWSLAPGEGPTGLEIDRKSMRLFAGCDKMLIVLNARDGKLVANIPIGDGCDGVGFDNNLHYVFASCGEGTLSVIEEKSADSFQLLEKVPTQRSARTIAVDESNHEVFLPAAEMQAAPAGERPRMVPGTFQILVISR